MPSFELEFEVQCQSCGGDLIARSEVKRSSLSPDQLIVYVEPCDTCMTDAKDKVQDLVSDRDSTISRLEQEIENLKNQNEGE